MLRFPTPSEMMRTKRPDLYSDSERMDAYRLSDTELRLHLDSLTDRNQHKDFEVFCRKLAEREICPNLRPQTGPEGGGDGKVDTETYPVDEAISDRWYVGDGASGRERWAFACSAKKTWAAKVRADVEGLKSTGRHYDRVFFFTSRAARQADRLRVEQELEQQYGMPVSIFDREWIVDRVFDHRHKDLAFEHLNAGALEADKVRIGPNDFRRQQELKEIEDSLSKLAMDARSQLHAVSDMFEAAQLSRELERPRTETDGRFLRAVRQAKKHGLAHQYFKALYEHAWTAVWWFDDIEGMLEHYDEIEGLAFGSGLAANVSKVCNLHQVLVSQIAHGRGRDSFAVPARSLRLRNKLEELSADRSRPNNALFAETLLAFHRMNVRFGEGERENFDDTWTELSAIIKRAEGLGEFPADLIDSVISALADAMPESAVFDRLIVQLAEFVGQRSREVAAGDIYLGHGERKLDHGKPIDAIRMLGRAVVNFNKEESREQHARALYRLSIGYSRAGLLWASRATALASISQYNALSEIGGSLRIELLPALKLLIGLSLQLGHVLDALAAHQFFGICQRRLAVNRREPAASGR